MRLAAGRPVTGASSLPSAAAKIGTRHGKPLREFCLDLASWQPPHCVGDDARSLEAMVRNPQGTRRLVRQKDVTTRRPPASASAPPRHPSVASPGLASSKGDFARARRPVPRERPDRCPARQGAAVPLSGALLPSNVCISLPVARRAFTGIQAILIAAFSLQAAPQEVSPLANSHPDYTTLRNA